MSQETRKRFAWLAVIIWTLLIFSFSIRPLDESSQQSTRVRERLLPVIEAVEEALGMDLIPDDNLHWIVRKMAHFTLFMVLGGLVFRAGRISGRPSGRALLAALLWVVLTAALDETIQTFIPGRSGELRDVVIDTAGGMMGMGVMLLFQRCSGHRKKVV
jgi:VanZ family protein